MDPPPETSRNRSLEEALRETERLRVEPAHLSALLASVQDSLATYIIPPERIIRASIPPDSPVLGRGGFSIVGKVPTPAGCIADGAEHVAMKIVPLRLIYATNTQGLTQLGQIEEQLGASEDTLEMIVRNTHACLTNPAFQDPDLLIPRAIALDEERHYLALYFDVFEDNLIGHLHTRFSELFGEQYGAALARTRRELQEGRYEWPDRTAFGDLLFGELLPHALHALDILHGAQTYHRDFKFTNVFVKPGRVALGDNDVNGIRKSPEHQPGGGLTSRQAGRGLIFGTRRYVPDRIYKGGDPHKVNGVSWDLYSVAAALLELVGYNLDPPCEGVDTGFVLRNQWRNENIGDLLAAMFGEKYRAVQEVIWRGTESDQKYTYKSAKEMAKDLGAIVRKDPLRAIKHPLLSRRIRKRHTLMPDVETPQYRQQVERRIHGRHFAAWVGLAGAIGGAWATADHIFWKDSLQDRAEQLVEQRYAPPAIAGFLEAAGTALDDDFHAVVEPRMNAGSIEIFPYGQREGEKPLMLKGTSVSSGEYGSALYLVARATKNIELTRHAIAVIGEQQLTLADEKTDAERPHNLGRFITGLLLSQDIDYLSLLQKQGALTPAAMDDVWTSISLSHAAVALSLACYDSQSDSFTLYSPEGRGRLDIRQETVLKPFLAGLLDSPYAQEALSGDLERIASIALPHLSGNGQKRLRAQIGTLSEGMRGSGITMRPWSRDDYMRMIVESTASSLEHLTWPYEHDGVRLRKSFARAFFDAEDGVWRRQLRYDYEPGYSLPGGKLPRELHMSEKSQRLTRLIYATSKTIAAVERSPHAREFADPLSLLRRDVEEFVGRYLSLTDGGRSPPPERFAERSLVAPEYGLPDSQTAAYFALGLHTLRDHPLNLGRYGVTHHDLEMRAQDVLFGGAFRQHTVTDRLPLLRTALGRPRIGLLWGQTGEETAYRGGNSDGDIALVQLVTAMGERK